MILKNSMETISLTVLFDEPFMPEYNFDWLNLLITLAVFVVVYEMIMLLFSLRIKKVSLKSVMAE